MTTTEFVRDAEGMVWEATRPESNPRVRRMVPIGWVRRVHGSDRFAAVLTDGRLLPGGRCTFTDWHEAAEHIRAYLREEES